MRDWASTIKLSSENENTQGCKFENDLGLISEELVQVDTSILATETSYLGVHMLSVDEVHEVATKCKALKVVVPNVTMIGDTHNDIGDTVVWLDD